MVLTGCSEDNEIQKQKRSIHIIPAMGTTPTVDITRGEGDQRYGDYIPADAYPVGTNIGLSFYDMANLSADPMPSPLVKKHTGTFDYKGIVNDNPKWGSGVTVEPSTKYKVFGHVPNNCSSSFVYNFSNESKTEGSKTYPENSITLTGIKPVSNTDVSVVVGVGKAHFWDSTNRNKVSMGEYDNGGSKVKYIKGAYPRNFEYFTSDGESGDDDIMYLLMDHLFVQTKFYFAIGENYHKLRDIRIKKIWMSATDIQSLDAVVYLNVTPAEDPKESEPTIKTAITSIDWSMVTFSETNPRPSDFVEEKSLIYSCGDVQMPTGWKTGTPEEKAVALSDEKSKGYMLDEVEDPDNKEEWVLVAPGFFSPVKVDDTPMTFKLITEYDVYDKKGNKTRSAATAINCYTTGITDIIRGTSYDVHITVEPTYLYQLSDGDLDNPTLKITTP